MFNTIYMTEDSIDKPWKIEHEKKHCEQQGNGFWVSLLWTVVYFVDKKFRREVEIEAFKVEYLANLDMDFYWLYHSLVNDYWGAFTVKQAIKTVVDIKNTVKEIDNGQIKE